MSLPINSEWRVEAESAPTRTIAVTKSETHTFTAEHVEPQPHGGVFTGEIRTRQKTVLSLRLRGEQTDYTAFFVGTREGDQDKYVGSWHDVAHGFSGKFRLIRTK